MQGRAGDYGTGVQPDRVCVNNFTMQITSYSAFFVFDTRLRKHASSEIKGQIVGTGRRFNYGGDRVLAKAPLVNFR